MVKNLPAMQESRVQSLIREVPLEKEMAIHSSILARDIPWMEEPGRPDYSPQGHKELHRTERLHFTSVTSQVLSLLILMSFSAAFDFASGSFLAALPLISTC